MNLESLNNPFSIIPFGGLHPTNQQDIFRSTKTFINRCLAITDPNHHVTSFTYDQLGRQTSRTLPEGQTERWVYRDCCRASEHFDFNTVAAGATTPTVTYEFDAMKREALRTYGDGKSIANQYNARGQLERVIYTGYEFGPGEPYQDRAFEYDPTTGRLVRDNKEDGQWIAYAYDLAGALIETSFPGNLADHVVAYSHDALNRLATVTDANGTTRYTYDKVGNRASMTYPNQTVATYDYDSLNRLLYLENSGPSGLISSYRYTLGPAGNRLKIIERYREPDDAQGNPSPIIEDICEYTYDHLYRLTRESRVSPAPGRTHWIEYTYDPFGNRLEMNAGGLATAYTYDSNDRLLTESPLGGLPTTYAWDSNGSMTGKTNADESWFYAWNHDIKLDSADLNSQPAASYRYDFQGERIASLAPSQNTNYLIDNNNQTGYSQTLRETDPSSSTELVSYTFGDDLISQGRDVISYYHYDGLGSSRALSYDAGNIIYIYSYLAFGSFVETQNTFVNNHLFIGEEFDNATSLSFLRARYYSPREGIFISNDPFEGRQEMALSFNNYIYSLDNPINYHDITGEYSSLIEILFVLTTISLLLVTGDSPLERTKKGRQLKNIMIKRNEIHINPLEYGHYWIELAPIPGSLAFTESYGWYPCDDVTIPWHSVPGCLNQNKPNDPYHGRSAEMQFNPYLSESGKCNKYSNDDVVKCIRKFANNYSGEWSWPQGQNCRTFQIEAMDECCLEEQ